MVKQMVNKQTHPWAYMDAGSVLILDTPEGETAPSFRSRVVTMCKRCGYKIKTAWDDGRLIVTRVR